MPDATEKMDSILSSETAWQRLAGPDSDDMKVTECADAFLTLLMTISDRYNHLPQPGHRYVKAPLLPKSYTVRRFA